MKVSIKALFRKLRTNYIFINRRMNKPVVVYSYNEIPPSSKTEYTIATFGNMGEFHKHDLRKRNLT